MSLFKRGWRAEAEAEALRRKTDEALARERAAMAQKSGPKPVFDLLGLPAQVGYLLSNCQGNARGFVWNTIGVTVSLDTACALVDADPQNCRATLVKVYRLPDGSLVRHNGIERLTEI